MTVFHFVLHAKDLIYVLILQERNLLNKVILKEEYEEENLNPSGEMHTRGYIKRLSIQQEAATNLHI